MTSSFPESLKLKRRDDFVVLATKNALSISKANNYILSGRPREGLAIYKKLAAMTPKIEKTSMALLYSKKSKFYSPKNILNLTDSIRKSSKEGLGLYLSRNQKEMNAYFRPSPSHDSRGDIYNDSQETIIRDPSIDIFQMIKKRYMQVHADGRL